MKTAVNTCSFASFLLVFLQSPTIAQDDFINSSGQQEAMKLEGHVEKKYVMKLEAPTSATKYCHVSVDITYLQKNTSAVVDVVLENPDCAASSGSYTVAVRVRDDNNKSQTLSFDETWQRDDDQSLETRQDYFIGDNVDLVNVRVRKLKCACSGLADEVGHTEDLTPKN